MSLCKINNYKDIPVNKRTLPNLSTIQFKTIAIWSENSQHVSGDLQYDC
jgi:hypothetical protein